MSYGRFDAGDSSFDRLRSLEFFDYSGKSINGPIGYPCPEDTYLEVKLRRGERLVGMKKSYDSWDVYADFQFIVARK